MIRKITLLSLCVLATVACKKGAVNPNKGAGKDLILSSTEQQKIGPDNAFTLKLFKANVNGIDNSENLILSPLSVSMAMGMTSNGASGQTLTDIRKTMNFDGFTEEQLNGYYNNLITNMPQLDPNTTLKIANSIWYANTFTPLPAFIKTNTDFYKATTQAVNFSNPATKDVINKWVSDQTNGKIPKIIEQIPDGARMFLINAIYFKSTWKERFDVAQTRKLPFNLGDNSTVQVDFMTNNIDFKSTYDADANIIELPYSNSK